MLAIPGDEHDRTAVLCNRFLHAQRARMCLSYVDVLRSIGATGKPSHLPRPHVSARVHVTELSPTAQTLLLRVPTEPVELDALMSDPTITSGEVMAALFSSSDRACRSLGRRPRSARLTGQKRFVDAQGGAS